MDPKPATYAPPPVIEPGHTFTTVTDKIAAIVLTKRHPYSWFFGLFVGFWSGFEGKKSTPACAATVFSCSIAAGR